MILKKEMILSLFLGGFSYEHYQVLAVLMAKNAQKEW